jgi:hypothetical protein
MKIKVNRHTGEYETKQTEITDTDGKKVKNDYREEILEEVQSIDVEGADAKTVRAARLRAELLTRETGQKHSVEVSE